MKRLILASSLLVLSNLSSYSQTANPRPAGNEAGLQRLELTSNLKALELETAKLDGPLARALAAAEIADAAWTLDRDWAKKILREAYRLTYPSEEEQSKFQPQPPGAASKLPTVIGRARRDVRRRILSVAQRDRVFADQLILDSSAHVTNEDRQMMHAQAARIALDEGDNEGASRSIKESIAVDPTQMVFVQLVNDLAIKDRAAADKLILDCLANLSAMTARNLSATRAYPVLMWLIFPNSFFPDPNKRIPDPSPAAMRAYVSYMIESLTIQEQREPGNLKRARSILLSVWLPLNSYAPELRERFMQLEALSRTPGEDASLPTQSYEEADKEKFRKTDKEALDSNEPNDVSIRSLIAREDFDKARTLIGKLPDGSRKAQLTEQLNTKEAISLVKEGDLTGAHSLAERLTQIGSMLQVYPVLVERYVTDRDQIGASAAVHRAIKQLKSAGPTPANATSFGLPASYVRSANEGDALLWSLGKLAKAVVPVDSLLASEIVDEMVARANSIQIDSTQGRTGFESDVFTQLTAKDEMRARSAAENFKGRLQRIVALAAVYQWKAKQLEKVTQEKAVRIDQQPSR